MRHLILTVLLLGSVSIISCKKEIPGPVPGETTGSGPESITGTSWTSVGAQLNGSVSALFVYDNKLFIGGNFFSVGSSSATGVAYWDGSMIQPVYLYNVGGTGFSSFGVDNGYLIGGGGFYDSFGGMAMCAQWNGSTWIDGGYWINSNVYAIRSFDHNLYIGGYFTTYNSVSLNRIARHSGSGWLPVGNGFNNSVLALTVYNNELYAAGNFTASGSTTVNHIAKWNGSSWVPVGASGLDGSVSAMVVYKNELYAAGNFTHADAVSARYIAKWNGSSWSSVGGGLTGGFNGARALQTFAGDLFVGGEFTGAGSTSVNNVARWNGTSWSAMGPGISNIVNAFAVYNGSLYAATAASSSNRLLRFE